MSNPTLDSDPSHPPTAVAGTREHEQRRHRRLELAVRCWITNERHTLYLRVHDISQGGLSVRAMVPFTPNGAIEVGLELPDGRRVRARGEVVWIRPHASGESGPRMGARFLDFLEGEDDFYALLGNA
ncbi:MAG: hypothetical protein JWN44_4786 [Myxococcales bacterium]|nr:hypothetical protein [Myxococcales bacterium]